MAGRVKQAPRTPKAKKELDPEEARRLAEKVDAARALGLWEKIQAVGWGGLSAAESGRVGGEMTRRERCRHIEAAQADGG